MTNRQTIHKFSCWYGIIGTLTAGQVGCSLRPISFRQISNGTKMDPKRDPWALPLMCGCVCKLVYWQHWWQLNTGGTWTQHRHKKVGGYGRIWLPLATRSPLGPYWWSV